MNITRLVLTGALAVATLVPGSGCLRRRETITVAPDQSVRIEVEYESERPEFGSPDAMPSKEAGWDAETIAEKQDNGEMEYKLVAGKSFAPGAELPRSYAAPGAPDPELYLTFPTELKVDRREEGTVYTLRRAYTTRPWAYVQYWEDRVMEGDVKKLLDKAAEELTDEERERVLKALATIEVLRRLELSRVALQRSGIEAYEPGWLEARQALMSSVDEINFAPILEVQKQIDAAPDDSPEKQAAEKQLAEMIEKLNDASLNAYANQLETTLGQARFDAYERALQRVTKEYDITKETGGHAFEIRVKMPGRIIAHNADKVEDDGTVVWEFDGKAFRDRDHELLVVSRLQTPTAESPR